MKVHFELVNYKYNVVHLKKTFSKLLVQ